MGVVTHQELQKASMEAAARKFATFSPGAFCVRVCIVEECIRAMEDGKNNNKVNIAHFLSPKGHSMSCPFLDKNTSAFFRVVPCKKIQSLPCTCVRNSHSVRSC